MPLQDFIEDAQGWQLHGDGQRHGQAGITRGPQGESEQPRVELRGTCLCFSGGRHGRYQPFGLREPQRHELQPPQDERQARGQGHPHRAPFTRDDVGPQPAMCVHKSSHELSGLGNAR